MDEKIKDAMHQAYTGESKASLRLKVFAERQSGRLPTACKALPCNILSLKNSMAKGIEAVEGD